MTSKLGGKRVWTVADFATHAYSDDSEAACLRARRFLKRLDTKHRGRLLIPSRGTNRAFVFYPSVLARLEPDLFTPVESIEFRLDAVEDDVAEVRRHQRIIASSVGQNARDIARLRTQRPVA